MAAMHAGESVNEAWQAFKMNEADMKKLKSTAGVDAHLMERDKT